MARRKGHPFQPSGIVCRKINVYASLRLSDSEIQSVTGASSESHEQPQPRLCEAGRLQLDRHSRDAAGGVRMLRAFERRGRDSGRRADVVEAIRLGSRPLERAGTIYGAIGGVILRITEAASPFTSDKTIPKNTSAKFPLFRPDKTHDAMQLNFSCLGFTHAPAGQTVGQTLETPAAESLDAGRTRTQTQAIGLCVSPRVGQQFSRPVCSAENTPLFFHTFRPHPHPIVGAKTIKNIVTWLQANEILL